MSGGMLEALANICHGKLELLIAGTCDKLDNDDDVLWAPSAVCHLCV